VVDVVVVTYNSRDRLRQCVAGLVKLDGVNVVVVDNDSSDGSLEVIADLPVETRRLERNLGFAVGCNVGWRGGKAPYVLFLNPDATLDERSLRRLVEVLDQRPEVGVVGPREVSFDGALIYSQRRHLRLGSIWAHALFIHRLFPRAGWAHEQIRDRSLYERESMPEWLSGACLLVRRDVLEEVGGFDERFFMYCEDDDLCRRVWQSGSSVMFEPDAVCVHVGGASAPRSTTLPIAAASEVKYAEKHYGSRYAALVKLGVVVRGLTHFVIARGGLATRAAHVRSIHALSRVDIGGRA
jgi:GT2 family glycosyltransferase